MKVRTNLRAGQGIGDAVENTAGMLGFDKIANLYEQLTGNSCGCEERKQSLNRMLPQFLSPQVEYAS